MVVVAGAATAAAASVVCEQELGDRAAIGADEGGRVGGPRREGAVLPGEARDVDTAGAAEATEGRGARGVGGEAVGADRGGSDADEAVAAQEDDPPLRPEDAEAPLPPEASSSAAADADAAAGAGGGGGGDGVGGEAEAAAVAEGDVGEVPRLLRRGEWRRGGGGDGGALRARYDGRSMGRESGRSGPRFSLVLATGFSFFRHGRRPRGG